MAVNPDFRDLFIAFNEESVEYLLVGAHAVGYYAEPRFTKDIDVWVRASPENAERVHRALSAFMGFPPDDITVGDLTNPETIYQIGVAPNRIDIIVGLIGLEFGSAWERRLEATYGDVPVHVMGRDDLITAKRASGRPLDLIDVEWLEKARQEGYVPGAKAPCGRRPRAN